MLMMAMKLDLSVKNILKKYHKKHQNMITTVQGAM